MAQGDDISVRVNFGAPFPVFPLQHVVLLPHGLVSLYIFEDRYRQMISRALDSSGQIALAVFDGDAFLSNYTGSPPVRPAVCVGQIAQHVQNADGTYNIALQGVCRAEIVREHAPDAEHLYRRAELRPLDRPSEAGAFDAGTHAAGYLRTQLAELISVGPMGALEPFKHLRDRLTEGADEDLSDDAFFDLMALCLFATLDGEDLRYRLLSEADPEARARFVHRQLKSLSDTLEDAEQQFDPEAPKGVSWN
jgi:ATP-dependent Lon protease